VVVVEPLNLELLNGLNRLNIAKRLNVLNRRRGTGVALRGKDSSEPIRFGSEFGEVNSQKVTDQGCGQPFIFCDLSVHWNSTICTKKIKLELAWEMVDTRVIFSLMCSR
jgi:hypothetical protein